MFFFFFNDTATTEIYTLSLHDALPISHLAGVQHRRRGATRTHCDQEKTMIANTAKHLARARSEEHTSELQSQSNLVCRLLLEKKKQHHTHTAAPSAPSHPQSKT